MRREDLLEQNLEGKVWYMKADTIPGLSCLAKDEEAVNKITALKERDASKVGYIVLIDSVERIEEFGIYLSAEERELMGRVWPGPYTIIGKTTPTKYTHVTSVDEPIGFRIPDDTELRNFLSHVGPMVSTSCNKSGSPAILDTKEAQEVFGEKIDFYIDTPEEILGRSSTIIKIIR